MSMRRRAALGAALSCLLLATLAAPASAATDQPLGVSVSLGQACISGTGPANKIHRIALLTPQGKLRARFRATSDSFGEWFGCFPVGGFTSINGGDKIRMRAGGAQRTVIVPNLLPSINRVTNVIKGNLQPGQTVEILVEHSTGFEPSDVSFHTATAGGNGRYKLNLSGEVDLVGGDIVVALLDTGLDQFLALAYVPFVQIEFRSNRLIGAAAPNTNLRFVLRNAGGTVKARRGASSFILGIFLAELHNSRGFAVYPEPGDWLSSNLASDALLKVPASALRARASTDVITGRCMPNSPYLLDTPEGSVTGTTNGSGGFTEDLSGMMNIKRRDAIALTCRYATGDYFVRGAFAVP